MAHIQQQQFCLDVAHLFPDAFVDKTVLDVGSLDINGNNRYLFSDCDYLGIDIGPGANVDLVCPVHLYPGAAEFDTIISTEAFEHDEFWQDSFRTISRLLRPGGLFLFSCATHGRPEHGTQRTSPGDAPFCGDYYRNLAEDDIRFVLDVDAIFERYQFSGNDLTRDLYFWGVKRNGGTYD